MSYTDLGYSIIDNALPLRELDQLCDIAVDLLHAQYKRLKVDFPGGPVSENLQQTLDQGVTYLAKHHRDAFDEFLDRFSGTLAFNRLLCASALEVEINRCLARQTNKALVGHLNKLRVLMPATEVGKLGWHREIFQTVPRSRFVQIWAPLFRPSTSQNGALQVLDASHSIELRKPAWKQNRNGVSAVSYEDSDFRGLNVTSVELELGQAILFDGFLVHRSGTNISPFPRYSVVGLYHDAEDENFLTPKTPSIYRGETPLEYHESLPDFF
jgi:ectoine hydroxylase-related dioxygenase (phytanoyl-CoA dioxygenase family)